MAALADPGVQYFPMTGTMSMSGSHHRQNCVKMNKAGDQFSVWRSVDCAFQRPHGMRNKVALHCVTVYRTFQGPRKMCDVGGTPV